jgi:hypothetical protein
MIYIIITTSINNKNGMDDYEHRKNRYMNSIESLLTLTEDLFIKPIIVENNGLRTTYLDELKCDVVYTNNNILNVNNKGITELLDIKHVINKYQIQDDDVVIKITGRYKLLDFSFLELVMNNSDEYDVFIKFFNVCELKYMYNDCVLGLFAIKCKYLKSFNYNSIQSPEYEFAEYIRTTIMNDKIMEVDTLNLECCFADDLRVLYV